MTADGLIHDHHRQERTTASAVGRPGARSHDQTDRPRPSRSRSGPDGQHGRDRPDWRRVDHRPADLKKVISSRARPSKIAGRRPIKHAGDRSRGRAIDAIGAIGAVLPNTLGK